MEFNVQTISHSNLLKGLPERTEDVLSRRFGLKGEKETLEEIGEHYGITRERVRQIQDDGLRILEHRSQSPECQKIFKGFNQRLEDFGSVKKEDALLSDLGRGKEHYVYFLLTISKQFQRFGETEDFHTFWATNQNAFLNAKKALSSFVAELQKKQQPLPLPKTVLTSYVEISKNILQGQDGFYGLREWPEINPRGIKDKAFIVLKKTQKPLHFSEVATLIGNGALRQTVHNELIKDQRFVLVGRGLYALKEWGYEPGIVREVITSVLKETHRPMAKEAVVSKVLTQRMVKSSTILLNLQNKKYFLKTSEGKYTAREV
ncbi:MAG: sigma factor-like helix-turn-helix DNA-binding protein [Candidatus Nealsonbacteria bacterium]